MDLNQEKELIQKAKNDPIAFEKLYDQNYSKIFNYILKRVKNLEVAQDITSETFLKAFKGLWLFRFKNIPFSAWLYRIASNEISNYFKKGSYKTVSLDALLEEKGVEPRADNNIEEDLKIAEKIQEQNKAFYEIQTLIQKLPNKYQLLIHLRFFEKKTLKEISQIMNNRIGTVKSGLSRGLEKLKKFIDEESEREPLLKSMVMESDKFIEITSQKHG